MARVRDVTHTMSKLLAVGKKMWLHINKEKTKCMVLSRRDENQPNLQVHNFTPGNVENFNYPEININSKNNRHRKTSERILSGNECFNSINMLLCY